MEVTPVKKKRKKKVNEKIARGKSDKKRKEKSAISYKLSRNEFFCF